jgi:hypothetical protein
MEKIPLTNFWLRRNKEPDLLRIVQWAQWKKVKIEDLTPENIRDALQTRVPNPDDNSELV